ncbi:hypothetical protein AK88_04179 [Plasmodium fragile]|uniref:Plasmodium RESA N-terminal domain-containing protein n=1 Tax=Plasmodium fragile TaxID=5857 RepID=A0A0D9QGX6_PLAFR|nr:uncharacterized protein AK88_04179 [Plasmodium fragile]KJP86208.1 hypothetical protein AK88_04179 [Plasmodium fragile]
MLKKKTNKKMKKTNKEAQNMDNLFYTENGQVNNEENVIRKSEVGGVKRKVGTQAVIVEDLHTWKDLDEGELIIKIKTLNGLISSDLMYSIWNSVYNIMRNKCFYREEKIWVFCEKIANSYRVPKESKMNIWSKVYYQMKEETIKTEKLEFNKIYPFIDNGMCEHEVFIKFIFDELELWKKKMKSIQSKWMHLLFLNLKFYRTRNMILLNRL